MEMDNTLILGGTTGIGRAIKDEMETRFGDVCTVLGLSQGCDFSRKEGLSQMIDTIRSDKPGNIVYNAGVNHLMRLEEIDLDEVSRLNAVNYMGLVVALSEFAKLVVAGNGQITHRFVHVGSISARVPQTHSLSYCASKAAARQAIMCAARELAPYGAYVNTVAPGPVSGTAMTDYVKKTVPEMRGMTPESAEAYQMSVIPLRRRVMKFEVADAVIYLLSSTGITGTEITVSGGL